MWHLGGYETATWTPNLYCFLSAMCSLVHSDPKKYPGTCPDRNAPPQRPGNIQNLFRFAVSCSHRSAIATIQYGMSVTYARLLPMPLSDFGILLCRSPSAADPEFPAATGTCSQCQKDILTK